jgi:choice-of-anchor A domain-containing protein
MTKKLVVFAACFFASCLVARADSAPFGVLSAYNLVALGTTGTNPIAGNIIGPTSSDNEGRIAAADQVTHTLNIGTGLGSDPWGSLANHYALVAAGGVNVSPAGGYFTLNGGGGVWASSNNANYYFNNGDTGGVTIGGTSPIDFAAARTAMQTLNTNLSGLTANGALGSVPGGNSTWTGLSGNSTTLNVFTLTAVQLQSDFLDFIVPNAQTGATIIVNVIGANPVLGNAVMVNGQQESDSNSDNNLILFNFENASTVTVNGQLDASILAPNAVLSGSAQMGGNFIAAKVGLTGEVHNDEWVGSIPNFYTPPANQPDLAPEPGTLTLMGSGVLLLAGLIIRRKLASLA